MKTSPKIVAKILGSLEPGSSRKPRPTLSIDISPAKTHRLGWGIPLGFLQDLLDRLGFVKAADCWRVRQKHCWFVRRGSKVFHQK